MNISDMIPDSVIEELKDVKQSLELFESKPLSQWESEMNQNTENILSQFAEHSVRHYIAIDGVMEELEKIKIGKDGTIIHIPDPLDGMFWHIENDKIINESAIEYSKAVLRQNIGFCGEIPRFKTDQD